MGWSNWSQNMSLGMANPVSHPPARLVPEENWMSLKRADKQGPQHMWTI